MTRTTAKRGLSTHGTTDYSDVAAGDARNHRRPVRFDYTDGYVGITEYEVYEPVGNRVVGERVLLSPKQWDALVEFVQRRHPRSPR